MIALGQGTVGLNDLEKSEGVGNGSMHGFRFDTAAEVDSRDPDGNKLTAFWIGQ